MWKALAVDVRQFNESCDVCEQWTGLRQKTQQPESQKILRFTTNSCWILTESRSTSPGTSESEADPFDVAAVSRTREQIEQRCAKYFWGNRRNRKIHANMVGLYFVLYHLYLLYYVALEV